MAAAALTVASARHASFRNSGGQQLDSGNKAAAEFTAHIQSHRSVAHESDSWGCLRKKAYQIVNSQSFEALIGGLVLVSFVAVIIEADYGQEVPGWLKIGNWIILGIYMVEVVLKVFVMRLKYFHFWFNNMDFLVVLVDLIGQILSAVGVDALASVTALRIFRMLKLARSFKVIVRFPQLALMVKGLMNAMSAAIYGVALLFVILTVWSICAVQFIDPVNRRVALTGAYDNCLRCEYAFSNVRSSLLTFVQQIIAGDSWGVVTIPVIEEAPETALFFGLVFVSVHFTIINVILAVIVDSALKASQEDAQEIVRKKAEEFNAAAHRLLIICKDMDEDGSGDLTKEELVQGFDDFQEFRDQLLAMDIHKEDMHVVFSILDSDGSGSVNYEEFVEELFKMKSHDSHTLLVFIKHYVTEIKRDVQEQMKGVLNKIMNKLEEQDGDNTVSVVKIEGPGAQVEEKQQCPRTSLQADALKDLGEELRSLRKAISEDLILSMKEMSQKSDAHKLLAASIAETAALSPDHAGGAGTCLLEVRDVEGQGHQLDKGWSKPCATKFAAQNGSGALQSDAGPRSQALPCSPTQRATSRSGWAMQQCCQFEKVNADRIRPVKPCDVSDQVRGLSEA